MGVSLFKVYLGGIVPFRCCHTLRYLNHIQDSLRFFESIFNIDRNPNNRIRSLILTKHRINDFFPSFELINCPSCSQIFKFYQYYPCQNHFFYFLHLSKSFLFSPKILVQHIYNRIQVHYS